MKIEKKSHIQSCEGEKKNQCQKQLLTDPINQQNSFLPKKRGNSNINLLGQLNVDKKYLQELIKRPGIVGDIINS